jgi:two-component system sensor histidine kinase HydH
MSDWRSYIRPTDLGWVTLFAFLAFFGPERNISSQITLIAMAAFQLLEARIAAFSAGRGRIAAILIKFALCYLLILYTGHESGGDWSQAFNSPYHVILLLPVISAATSLGPWATLFFTVFACLEYCSFYLFIDQSKQIVPPEEWPHVLLRIATYPLMAFLTYFLAEENRKKARDAEAAAAQLEEANRNLQAAEDAVRRADRLAALGQMTAGLAHELRNPLSTIKSSSEILLTSLPPGYEVAHELAGFISTEVDRTNSLITRFLDFARPLKLKPETADVMQIIDQAIEQLERRTPPFDVTIHKNYSPDVPLLEVDPELMGLVFYNLLLNAAQASAKGASITVKTRLADSTAEIAVIDRGSGVSQENLKNIFNPFFTTKSDGVGLGLAIVSKIVAEHKGKLTVDSAPKEGSVFHVFLPSPKRAV